MTTSAAIHAGPEAGVVVADDDVSRAERRVADRQKNVVSVEKEKGNLRLFPVLSLVLPIPAFFIADWKIALFVCGSCWLFYAAGLYLNFMHVRNARQDLESAVAELERQRKKAGRA